MIETPFGFINVFLDGEKINCIITKIPPDTKIYPNINGAFLLSYSFISDGNEHILQCVLNNDMAKVDIESGERLEVASMYINGGKISIGTECDFNLPKEYNCDFCGKYLKNGLEIHINPKTKSQVFYFGIAWVLLCTKENDVQTWYAADPFVIKRTK